MPNGTLKWSMQPRATALSNCQAGQRRIRSYFSRRASALVQSQKGQTIEYEEVSNRAKMSAENLKVHC
jgi:hypothetical protein